MSLRRILIAVDEYPIAAHAADVGLDLAKCLGAEVAFIHVIDPRGLSAPESGIPADRAALLAEQEGKRLVAGFRERMPTPATALEFVQIGQPVSKIVEAARQWPADLIVVGSHGRAGITRTLLGSVAEGIMRHSMCPVLVVRAKQ
ncbi:MAG TPA: universal stress protein [Candidatus Angelobacter sp.]